MLGTILYIAGIVLAVLAVIDILKKPISLVGLDKLDRNRGLLSVCQESHHRMV